jgi:hypothetical protein
VLLLQACQRVLLLACRLLLLVLLLWQLPRLPETVAAAPVAVGLAGASAVVLLLLGPNSSRR